MNTISFIFRKYATLTIAVLSCFIIFFVGLRAYRNLLGTDIHGVIQILSEDMGIQENDQRQICCLGTQILGQHTWLWFSIGDTYIRSYRVVECETTSDGRYHVKRIHEPMVVAEDILLCTGPDRVCMVLNESCRTIVFRDHNGEIMQKVSIENGEHPFFTLLPETARKTEFIDAEGVEIR